jgi:WD40 repeat protein
MVGTKMKQYKQMQPAVFEKKEELLPVCSESGFNGEPKVIKGPLGESLRSVTWLSNNVLATAGDDCATTLHDLTTENTSVTAPHSSRVWSVATTSDGSLSASGGKDGAIVLFNAVKGVLSTVQGHEGEINCVAFSNTGRFLASASDDHTVVVWDVSQPAAPVQVSVLRGHTGWVRACTWSPDGRLLATGGADRTLRLWTIDAAGAGVDCHVVEHSHSLSLRGLAFSPGWAPAGGLLATACFDNVARLFALKVDAAGRVQQAHFKQSLFGHTSGVWTVCWSPDGTLLASGGAQPPDAPHTLSPPPPSPVLTGHVSSLLPS